MAYSIDQINIFPYILEARCGNSTALKFISEETEKYLKSVIDNFKIPTKLSQDEVVYEVLLKVFYNLHIYNPQNNTFSSWLLSMLHNHINELLSEAKSKKIPKLNWDTKYYGTKEGERISFSDMDPYDSIYVKELRNKLYNITVEIDDPKKIKALLFSFQNPCDIKYWAKVLEIEDDQFRELFQDALEQLKALLFDDKKHTEFNQIISMITNKLNGSLYLTSEELEKLNGKMKDVMANSHSFNNISEAAAQTGVKEDEYRTLLHEAMLKISNKLESIESQRKIRMDIEEEAEEKEKDKSPIETLIDEYMENIFEHGLKRDEWQRIYSTRDDFLPYKKTIDFLYLMFSSQFRIPAIKELLEFAINNNASDLHLSTGLPPVTRIYGEIKKIDIAPLDTKIVQNLVNNTMNELQKANYRNKDEVDYSFELPNLARFRVNAFNHDRGPGAVIRIIPLEIKTLEDIMAPPIVKDIVNSKSGLVLVTGPTGCGKSTTLAALVDYKNKNDCGHILTIEDPIEFIYESHNCIIHQREVHRDTKSFSGALRAALREDPDIILVGEMRDLETIRLALTAVETGHLVLGTLHTSSAAKTIDRIINVFPAEEESTIRFLFAESLRAVLSQILVKKKGGGVVAVWEIMIANMSIRTLIREGRSHQINSALQMGQNVGMQTLNQHLEYLIDRGIVDPEDVKPLLQKEPSEASYDFDDDFDI